MASQSTHAYAVTRTPPPSAEPVDEPVDEVVAVSVASPAAAISAALLAVPPHEVALVMSLKEQLAAQDGQLPVGDELYALSMTDFTAMQLRRLSVSAQ